MLARLRAELLRIATQRPVWIFAGVLVGVAASIARWSPDVVDLTRAAPPRLTLSLAGMLETASVQLATGLGVMLAALFAAAGPGRDFADGSAETRQVRGSAAQRFGSRVLAVALATIAGGLAAALLLVAANVAIHARNDYSLRFTAGRLDATRVATALALVVVHATWVVAVAERLRTQAAQLTLPAAVVVVMFLVSRLSPYPLTPDSWLGPLLGLEADRAMLDFWWSVGGKVLWPWGNALLVAGTGAVAAVFGVRADQRGRLRRLT